MSMMKDSWIEITLAEGEKLRFKFPAQYAGENAVQRIEEMLKLPSISISAGDKLYVIPISAIRTITVTPAPRKLPATVIRAATRDA